MGTVLSRRPCGRVVLHFVAMVCDGQVRWHCAGILREFAL